MGRAERRRAERCERIENRKGKILVSREDFGKTKQEITNVVSHYNTEALMTCFALAQHRLFGFGSKRILRTLEYIDTLMGEVNSDHVTVEDLKEQLSDETGIAIKCS